MGIGPFSGSSYCSCDRGNQQPQVVYQDREVPMPNPDPERFRIARLQAVGFWTVVEARYEGVTNYEGRKVMVYAIPEDIIRSRRVLDPHFCDSSYHPSPFARFEPTPMGWEAAVELATRMNARQGQPDAARRSAWERLMEVPDDSAKEDLT